MMGGLAGVNSCQLLHRSDQVIAQLGGGGGGGSVVSFETDPMGASWTDMKAVTLFQSLVVGII